MMQSLMAHKNTHIKKIRSLFADLAGDESNIITLTELEEYLRDDRVQAYFASLELQPGDAWELFKLFDTDGQNAVDIDEFLSGCMRLKGTARALDIAKLAYESKWLSMKFTKFIGHVEHRLTAITQMPGSALDPTLLRRPEPELPEESLVHARAPMVERATIGFAN